MPNDSRPGFAATSGVAAEQLLLDKRAYYCAENVATARAGALGMGKYIAAKIVPRRFRVGLRPEVSHPTEELLTRWSEVSERASLRLAEAWRQSADRYAERCRTELDQYVAQLNAATARAVEAGGQSTVSPSPPATADHYMSEHRALEKEYCEAWQEMYLRDLEEYGEVASRPPYVPLFHQQSRRQVECDSCGDDEDEGEDEEVKAEIDGEGLRQC